MDLRGGASSARVSFAAMTVQEAVQQTIATFPFSGYMTPGGDPRATYFTIGEAALRHLGPGTRVLDFGCGPMDKTAVLSRMGFDCAGYDDLRDYWHNLEDNRNKILEFARDAKIDFKVADGSALPFAPDSFDLVMLLDVIEHLHDSPKDLLNDLLGLVKPGGLLMITVPNAVNVRKRLDVLRGRTNYPSYESFYWYPGPWRGHVREYVKGDLERLTRFLGLDLVELRGCDHILYKLPGFARPPYRLITGIFPGLKDTWLLVARKPEGWSARKTLPEKELGRILGRSTAFQYD